MGDFGVTIAIPVVLFVYCAQYLRETYNIGAWLTVVAFVLAAVLSGYTIWKKAKKYGKEYNDIEK